MKYIPCDIEANALLPDVTKIHCLSMNWDGDIRTTNDTDKIRELVQRDDITLVGHFFGTYDVPVMEKVLGIKVLCGVVDTGALSWYLYPKRKSHGLESWGEEFGHPKVEVDESEWATMTYERSKLRAEQDVVIQTKLWEKCKEDLHNLYEGNQEEIESILKYLSFKMYQFKLQGVSKMKIDIPKIHENIEKLETIKKPQFDILKAALPSVEVKSPRQPPAKPFKQDGELSATGIKWKKLTEERSLPFEHNEPIVVIKDYVEPNPDSVGQLKDWLFSLGWKPLNFNTNKANGNEVPQIYIKVGEDTELCPSVKKIDHPAIGSLDRYGMLRSRIGLLNGYLKKERNGYLTQQIGGLTNTLRIKHSEIVNVPKNSKPWGKYVREVFIANEGKVICGADLSSLENKTRDHFIYPYDPEYVKEMSSPDFDSHTDTAVIAGLR